MIIKSLSTTVKNYTAIQPRMVVQPSTFQNNNPTDEADVNVGIQPLWLVEKNAIEAAIFHCQGNIPKAAAMLEVSPSTIYRKKLSW
jgi:two-component system repressor protein LuxO